jgi:hypothetical protein
MVENVQIKENAPSKSIKDTPKGKKASLHLRTKLKNYLCDLRKVIGDK